MTLIPGRWYAVLESREVPTGKPLGVRRLGESLVFWRDGDGRVVAMRDRCPHRGSQLSLGQIVDGQIQCPFHGFEFDPGGACRLIPANGRAARIPEVFRCATYPAREEQGFIWVWCGRPRGDYPPVPWFAGLEGREHATFRQVWETDWTRAVEGLLDVSHLPFVHRRTIGRDRKTLVNGPYTTLADDTIRVWVANQPDEGLPAIKPSQLPPPEGEPMLEFMFPNLWHLRVGDRVRIVNVVAPIEEGRCMIYVRTYVRPGLPPALGRMLARIGNVFNRIVLAEDYPVIRSQHPAVADLEIGEHFIPADRPIAIFLQQRRDLIEADRLNGRPVELPSILQGTAEQVEST